MAARPPSSKFPSRQALSAGQLLAAQGQTVTAGTGGVAEQGSSVDSLVQSGMKQLQRQFEALLQNDATIEPEQRQEMERFFEQALEDASASQAPIHAEVFDRNTWRETVDLLRQSGGIADDEADHLIRTLNDALAPLERRESRLALEFSRRLEADGEERAVEWLRTQAGTEDVDAVATVRPSTSTPASLGMDVINSRSRRLRGPPR